MMITGLKITTTDLFSRIDNYYLKIENNTINMLMPQII